MMRIITGKARGVRLTTLAGENTRPTSERAKEAIFSMLQFEIEGREVLDLFSGSGQMGLEALSRGAKHAVLCDRSREAIDVIRSNALKTRLAPQCDIFCSDAETLLHNLRHKQRFDLVFLDPPYKLGLIPDVLKLLIDCGLLSEGAKIVCESGAPEDVFADRAALADHFEILRTTRYGVAFVTLLQVKTTESGAEA